MTETKIKTSELRTVGDDFETPFKRLENLYLVVGSMLNSYDTITYESLVAECMALSRGLLSLTYDLYQVEWPS